MKKHESIKTKIAALSPCVAKAHEFEATHIVDYNVTMKKIMQYIEENHIAFPREASGFDHYDAGLGTLYPMPGGLKENVEHYIGKALRVDKSEGPQVVYKALDEYAEQPESHLPVLFDVLNCQEGCNLGTGYDNNNKSIFDINSTMDQARQSFIKNGDTRKYLDELFERFDKTLRLDDFFRNYTPTTAKPIHITQAQIDDAYVSLNKLDKESRSFDCGSCGCNSCDEMAQKIAKGINIPANCAEKSQKDLLKSHNETINFQTTNLSNFEAILEDTALIKEMTENITVKMKEITGAITAYNRMITDIEKIAMQVNIIAINASIESARAGEHGKTFGVVAQEIKDLAKSSNDSAQQTKDTSSMANSAIASVNEIMEKINESVLASYGNIQYISDSTRKLLEGS